MREIEIKLNLLWSYFDAEVQKYQTLVQQSRTDGTRFYYEGQTEACVRARNEVRRTIQQLKANGHL